MRAIVAKRIRRQVYGSGHHPGPVIYSRGFPFSAKSSTKDWVKKAKLAGQGICLLADVKRIQYKRAKLAYVTRS